MIHQEVIELTTPGRQLIDITSRVELVIENSAIYTGLCHLFIQHTSASLLIGENADPTVLSDLEAFMHRLIPDGDPLFQHNWEGVDDMPSHIRSVLTQTSIVIPITARKLMLGTWQGIFLWEHRLHPHHRKVTISLAG